MHSCIPSIDNEAREIDPLHWFLYEVVCTWKSRAVATTSNDQNSRKSCYSTWIFALLNLSYGRKQLDSMAEKVSLVQGVFPVWSCFLHDCLIELKAGSQSQPAGPLDGRLFPRGQCGSAWKHLVITANVLRLYTRTIEARVGNFLWYVSIVVLWHF